MRKIFSSLIWLLVAFLPLAAQSNPYEIDDDCYIYFQQAEASFEDFTSDEFDQNASALQLAALETGDDKAMTLYYVLMLKRACAAGRQGDRGELQSANKKVEAARKTLQVVAQEKGFIQYYYYGYDLAQAYYFNTNQSSSAMALLDEMYEIAKSEQDDYGQWQALRFISRLHLEQGDALNARSYLRRGLDIFEKTKDPSLRRQSMTRMYCDMADTYSIADDSARLFYNRALQSSKVHLDTLRCVYYSALVAAYDGDQEAYRRNRDYCLEDPSFETLYQTGDELFLCMDMILRGDAPSPELLDKLQQSKQQDYVGRLSGKKGLYEVAYYMIYKRFMQLLHNLSKVNESRLDEYSGRYDNFSLSRQLLQKDRETIRLYRLAAILLSVILLGAFLFLFVYIQHLRKDREKDEERIEALKVADAAKTRFVQNMSHEVRTPLNAIVGFSQLLTLPDGSFPQEEKDEFAEHIVNNTKMLTMLLDDILNTSAMDSGNYRISYEEGEVHFICRAAISSAEHRLQPGVQMVYEPDSETPFTFQTDPRRVQQILINLLTNACKHTPSGIIKLTSSVREHQGRVTFAVTDTGPGIPPEQAEVIFERFTKLNEFVQGTGLGLSICRDIAGRMGAKVYLDTSYKGGARFVFEVPLVPPTENM